MSLQFGIFLFHLRKSRQDVNCSGNGRVPIKLCNDSRCAQRCRRRARKKSIKLIKKRNSEIMLENQQCWLRFALSVLIGSLEASPTLLPDLSLEILLIQKIRPGIPYLAIVQEYVEKFHSTFNQWSPSSVDIELCLLHEEI